MKMTEEQIRFEIDLARVQAENELLKQILEQKLDITLLPKLQHGADF